MAIRFSGINNAQREARALPQDLHRNIEAVMAKWGEAFVANVQADHPYQDRTGRLTGSISSKLVPFGAAGGSAQIWLTVGMLYAEYVEFGTVHARPYPYFWPKVYQQFPALQVGIQQAMDAAVVQGKG
jgi:hypothetical protein